MAADNCNVASDFMALNDDSGVDNASFSPVSFGQHDVSSGSGTDSGDDFFSCCESYLLSSVDENIMDELRT